MKSFGGVVLGSIAGGLMGTAAFFTVDGLIPRAAYSQVSDEVHQRCEKAADYLGCVKAQTIDPGSMTVITRDGAPVAEGNACPGDKRYSGGGICTEWTCSRGTGRGHHQELAGKDSGCRYGAEMWWGSGTARAYFDPKCPDMELRIGWKNTCNQERKSSSSGYRPLRLSEELNVPIWN